jgi:hypothetical protein
MEFLIISMHRRRRLYEKTVHRIAAEVPVLRYTLLRRIQLHVVVQRIMKTVERLVTDDISRRFSHGSRSNTLQIHQAQYYGKRSSITELQIPTLFLGDDAIATKSFTGCWEVPEERRPWFLPWEAYPYEPGFHLHRPTYSSPLEPICSQPKLHLACKGHASTVLKMNRDTIQVSQMEPCL